MMENIKLQMKALYDKECRMYNVGIMIPYMEFMPKTLEEIIESEKSICSICRCYQCLNVYIVKLNCLIAENVYTLITALIREITLIVVVENIS